MKVKSKISLLLFILLLMQAAFAMLLFLWCLLVTFGSINSNDNKYLILLIFSWSLFVLMLMVLIFALRKVVLFDDRMEIVYLFGLFKISYDYYILKMTYLPTLIGEEILLTSNRKKIHKVHKLGYRNFSDLKEGLESKVEMYHLHK